jgi:hypothetical protein
MLPLPTLTFLLLLLQTEEARPAPAIQYRWLVAIGREIMKGLLVAVAAIATAVTAAAIPDSPAEADQRSYSCAQACYDRCDSLYRYCLAGYRDGRTCRTDYRLCCTDRDAGCRRLCSDRCYGRPAYRRSTDLARLPKREAQIPWTPSFSDRARLPRKLRPSDRVREPGVRIR